MNLLLKWFGSRDIYRGNITESISDSKILLEVRILFKKSMIILFVSIFIGGLLGCGNNIGSTDNNSIDSTKNVDSQTFNFDQARQISDAIAQDLINHNQDRLWEEAGKSERERKTEFDEYTNRMIQVYGQLLEVRFKKYEFGTETNLNGTNQAAKFWYAVKTTKYDIGTCFLLIDVASVNNTLLGQDFSIASFPSGTPQDLR